MAEGLLVLWPTNETGRIYHPDPPKTALYLNGYPLGEPGGDSSAVLLATLPIAELTGGTCEVSGQGELLVTAAGKTYRVDVAVIRGTENLALVGTATGAG